MKCGVVKTIKIDVLREYYKGHKVFMSEHASNRCMQREITQKDVRNCIMTGEIIEQYPDDFPWPSCLIAGHDIKGRIIHVVASDNGSYSKIITSYIPNTEIFESDLKTRIKRGKCDD